MVSIENCLVTSAPYTHSKNKSKVPTRSFNVKRLVNLSAWKGEKPERGDEFRCGDSGGGVCVPAGMPRQPLPSIFYPNSHLFPFPFPCPVNLLSTQVGEQHLVFRHEDRVEQGVPVLSNHFGVWSASLLEQTVPLCRWWESMSPEAQLHPLRLHYSSGFTYALALRLYDGWLTIFQQPQSLCLSDVCCGPAQNSTDPSIPESASPSAYSLRTEWCSDTVQWTTVKVNERSPTYSLKFGGWYFFVPSSCPLFLFLFSLPWCLFRNAAFSCLHRRWVLLQDNPIHCQLRLWLRPTRCQ